MRDAFRATRQELSRLKPLPQASEVLDILPLALKDQAVTVAAVAIESHHLNARLSTLHC